MSKSVVTARYAKAMIDGLSGAHLKDLQSDMKQFLEIVENSDLSKAISLPMISKTTFKTVFDRLFAKAKPHLRLQGMVLTLVEHGRVALLPDVLRMAQRLITAQGGELDATVVSAKPLSDAEKQSVAAALTAKAGKTVTIATSVDESLIGGMVVRVGSLQIDDSVKTKLERLRRDLIGKAA